MNRIKLEGDCYVVQPADLEFEQHSNWFEAPIINRKLGSQALAQNYLKLSYGKSAIKRYPESDVVLFVLSGKGSIIIGGQNFSIIPENGIYVQPGEAYQFVVDNELHLIEGICPQGTPQWPEKMKQNFNFSYKKRTVHPSERKRVATGDRFYQLLVSKKMGSKQVTQFIGSIPKSKAPEHFHLYEEAITILDGTGFMWAGNQKTAVSKGSMIFLPKEQPHCLECTSDNGLKLMGIFYPAGSPTVNYKS